jgi:uroporphyrinogen decarboxylase
MGGVTEPAFLAACNGRPTSRTPVWFMRQAGRSLPEYRELRKQHPVFDDVIHQPELAAEVTLQPVRRLGVDAAILFSDLLTPVQAIVPGIHVDAGVGPVVDEPFRSKADLDRLRPLDAERDVPYVLEAARIVSEQLPDDVPLIGFAGAPFTVASYLVEGGKSRDYLRTKSLMLSDTDTWTELSFRLADITIAALRAQVAAGARAVQVFDSWVGSLSADDYWRYVMPAMTRIFDGLADLGVPRIHFGVGTQHLVTMLHQAGADVVGLDWRTRIDDARALLGDDVPVQGNLDPISLFAPQEVLDGRVRDILDQNAGRPGHVFNLGWGVLPETDPDVLKHVVDVVHGDA